MKQTHQPFTDQVTRRNRGSIDSATGWVIAIFVIILSVLSWYFWHSSKVNRQELQTLDGSLKEATATLSDARAENQKNQDLIAELKTQLAELEKEREVVKEKAKGLEDEMRADLESKDVTISKLQGKLTVNILDRVMFNSGEAILKPDGEAVMKKIATFLAEHPELKIHVIGHTDNIPIRPEAHSRFLSNWELSTARALAALHYLTENAGVDPHRVAAVGYGEYRPIADNSTAEGRAKNRRIAIMILPDELVEPETAAVAPSSASNN
jgi:chemotaxis protein MotB